MKKEYYKPNVEILSVMSNQGVLLLESNTGISPAPARRGVVSYSPAKG